MAAFASLVSFYERVTNLLETRMVTLDITLGWIKFLDVVGKFIDKFVWLFKKVFQTLGPQRWEPDFVATKITVQETQYAFGMIGIIVCAHQQVYTSSFEMTCKQRWKQIC